jgi:nucleotidyltransferase/DNA polymerase involved in DNA repair
MPKREEVKMLTTIPGVGKSISKNLYDIGIRKVSDLKGQNPEKLYALSNKLTGTTQDRCLLYVFRCAVYFAETKENKRDKEKLKWWNWKDKEKATK